MRSFFSAGEKLCLFLLLVFVGRICSYGQIVQKVSVYQQSNICRKLKNRVHSLSFRSQSDSTYKQDSIVTNHKDILYENNEYYIYEAKRSDLPSIVQLRTQVFHPTYVGNTAYFTDRMLDLSSRYNLGSLFYLARLKETVQSSTTSLLLTSRVIGTVEINDFDFTSYRSNLPLTSFGAIRKLYLGDLAVSSAMRRRRIGSNLLQIIDNYAKLHDYEEIYLHVDKNTPQLLSFYEENGYQVYPYCSASLSFTQQRLPLAASNYLLLRRCLSP